MESACYHVKMQIYQNIGAPLPDIHFLFVILPEKTPVTVVFPN
jgi:hypothetical protein